MSRQTLYMPDALHEWLVAETVSEPPVLRRLREQTESHPLARMQISPEQGQFLAWLVEVSGCRLAIELGTFTGYSSTWMALAMPADGRLVCCDVSEEHTAEARRVWCEAGVEARIELRLGPALDSLKTLAGEGLSGRVDLMFIDADKENTGHYVELGLGLLRSGGVIAVDNAFHGGLVSDPQATDAQTPHRAVCRALRSDPRVAMCVNPIGDGMILLRKR